MQLSESNNAFCDERGSVRSKRTTFWLLRRKVDHIIDVYDLPEVHIDGSKSLCRQFVHEFLGLDRKKIRVNDPVDGQVFIFDNKHHAIFVVFAIDEPRRLGDWATQGSRVAANKSPAQSEAALAIAKIYKINYVDRPTTVFDVEIVLELTHMEHYDFAPDVTLARAQRDEAKDFPDSNAKFTGRPDCYSMTSRFEKTSFLSSVWENLTPEMRRVANQSFEKTDQDVKDFKYLLCGDISLTRTEFLKPAPKVKLCQEHPPRAHATVRYTTRHYNIETVLQELCEQIEHYKNAGDVGWEICSWTRVRTSRLLQD